MSPRQRYAGDAPGKGAATVDTLRGGSMHTDKIIAKKDGAIGRMTFNNPQLRNAISL